MDMNLLTSDICLSIQSLNITEYQLIFSIIQLTGESNTNFDTNPRSHIKNPIIFCQCFILLSFLTEFDDFVYAYILLL